MIEPGAPDRDALRVVLVDDHVLFRAGVRALLISDLGIDIVGEFGDSVSCREQIPALDPDVAVIDVSLKGDDGIELVRWLQGRNEDRPRCLVLSMHAGGEYVARAFGAGALGYVVKDAGPNDLIAAISAVAAGRSFVSPSAAGSLASDLRQAVAAPHLQLSPRQLEVLRLVALGHSTKVIARMLDLSPKTVDAHRYQVCQRLGLHDVAGLVRYAIRYRLVEASS